MSPSLLILLLLLIILPTTTSNSTTNSSLCNTTPYPSSCLASLKLSISIPLPPLLSLLLHSLHAALSSSSSLLPLLSSSSPTLQDCQQLHSSTILSLQKTSALIQHHSGAALSNAQLSLINAHLSAALTNKNTCLEGLQGSAGTVLVEAWLEAYRHVSNSLSLISQPGAARTEKTKGGRKLLSWSFPKWMRKKDRRLLQTGDAEGYVDPASVLYVAADGSGNFTTITDAIAFAPNMSDDRRTVIIVRAGVYEENVEVPGYKPNMVLLGEGSDVTVIRANRSAAGGWTTFRSATLGE